MRNRVSKDDQIRLIMECREAVSPITNGASRTESIPATSTTG